MRVVKQHAGGIVRRVVLVDDAGDEVVPVNRFLSHLVDAGYSPNTVCAYGYDLRHLLSSWPSARWAGTISVQRSRWSSSATCDECRRDGRRSALV